jgi:glycosyltransferase involved in cell wall biosynthesis
LKLISIVSPCYNEEGNVEELLNKVRVVFQSLPNYRWEIIFIDNASTDSTRQILRRLTQENSNVRAIFNSRNFGHIRSPFHGILQAQGDAVILMVSDLQDPPETVIEFVKKWEDGYKIVRGIKGATEEGALFSFIRKAYYFLVYQLADIKLEKNFTGFGLYDKVVVDVLRKINDPYPYFRGLISEIGFPNVNIKYFQPLRKRGITKNNFYTLYDIAMLGITNHSKIPLRLAAFLGFISSLVFFMIGSGYLIAKLILWNTFSLGIAPMVIGLSFFASLQLLFLGILGEYIGSIHTIVLRRPLVIEQERLNF